MFPFLLTLVLAKEAGTKIVSGDWDSKIEDIFEIPHEVNTFFSLATILNSNDNFCFHPTFFDGITWSIFLKRNSNLQNNFVCVAIMPLL